MFVQLKCISFKNRTNMNARRCNSILICPSLGNGHYITPYVYTTCCQLYNTTSRRVDIEFNIAIKDGNQLDFTIYKHTVTLFM